MLKWILGLSLIIGVFIFGFIYTKLHEGVPQGAFAPAVILPQTVTLNHLYKDGEHRFTGQIMLPHSCYLVKKSAYPETETEEVIFLKLDTTDISDRTKSCSVIATRYPFDMLYGTKTENPITIKFFINDAEVPTNITDLNWQSPRGRVINAHPDKAPL